MIYVLQYGITMLTRHLEESRADASNDPHNASKILTISVRFVSGLPPLPTLLPTCARFPYDATGGVTDWITSPNWPNGE